MAKRSLLNKGIVVVVYQMGCCFVPDHIEYGMFRYYPIDFSVNPFPSLENALRVWEKKREGKFAPAWGDVHFFDFDVSLIPKMLLVDIDGGEGLGFYRFCGTGVALFDPHDYTNRRINSIGTGTFDDLGIKNVEQYQLMVRRREPLYFVLHHMDKEWGFQYESTLRLPMSSDGKEVDKVLGIIEQAGRGSPEEKALIEAVQAIH